LLAERERFELSVPFRTHVQAAVFARVRRDSASGACSPENGLLESWTEV